MVVKLVSQAKFSRMIGLTQGRISQLVKQKVIVLKQGKVDPDQANAAIEANVDFSRKVRSQLMKERAFDKKRQLDLPGTIFIGPPGNGTGDSLTETKRQHEEVKMELSKLKLEVEKGNLVPKSQFTESLIWIISNARIRLLSLPKRTALAFAIETDPKKIEATHMLELRQILKEMAASLNGEQKKRCLDEDEENLMAQKGGGDEHNAEINNVVESDGEQSPGRNSLRMPIWRTPEENCSVVDGETEKGNSENPQSGDCGDFPSC